MNGESLIRSITISNPQGLHMRPISAFVQLANKFNSSVFVLNSTQERFDGKSPLSLLGLGAEKGTRLVLEVRGPDQEEAMEALVNLIDHLAEFDEEIESENPPVEPK